MNVRHLAQAMALAGPILATPGLASAQADAAAPSPIETPAPAPVQAPPPAPGQLVTMNGIIVSRDGAMMVVKVAGADIAMTLSPAVSVQQVVGALGLRREDHSADELVKGLAISIEATQTGSQIYVTKVTFKAEDMKTAKAIAAGTEEAKRKIVAEQAENKRRLADSERRLSLVGQFSEKARTRVFFDTGSAAINAQGKADLQKIAGQALATPGALVRVVGHTDSTGSAATNQRLSAQRASAVTAYLLEQCSLPPEKLATAGGLGSYVPAEPEEPQAGSAQNRRVTVFVLVSKASEPPADSAGAATP